MKIGKFFKNILLNAKILWHSLFVGMKDADQKTMGVTKEGKIADGNIEQQVSQDSVYADMLKGEVTQEVKELRDSSYRGYKASFDYKYIGNGNVIKKTSMINDDIDAFNPENMSIYLVQDNKLITRSVKDALDGANSEGDEVKNENADYSITIERDNFPRFLIEKYVKRVVVRRNETETKIDLYCSTYPRQYMPTDSVFIVEIRNILEGKIKPNDTVEIDSIEFITDGCYGAKDIMFFKFSNLEYESINVYDGNFVITYSAFPLCDGVDLTEQYRTEEMDKKYENKEMRENATFTYIEKEESTLDINQALKILNDYSD